MEVGDLPWLVGSKKKKKKKRKILEELDCVI